MDIVYQGRVEADRTLYTQTLLKQSRLPFTSLYVQLVFPDPLFVQPGRKASGFRLFFESSCRVKAALKSALNDPVSVPPADLSCVN